MKRGSDRFNDDQHESAGDMMHDKHSHPGCEEKFAALPEGALEWKCKIHGGCSLDFFCKNHSCLCCEQCKQEGGYHHRCHVKPFNELSQGSIQKTFSATARRLNNLVKSAQKFSKDGLLRKQQAFEQNIQSAKDKIHTTFQMLRELIDAREQELLAEVDQVLADYSPFGSEEYVHGLDNAATALRRMNGMGSHLDVPRSKEAVHMIGEGHKAARELEMSLKGVVESLCKGATATMVFDDTLGETIKSLGEIKLDLVSTLPKITAEEVFSDKVAISWNPVPFNATYKVKMSANTRSGFVELYKGKETMCAIGNLRPDTEHVFWVQLKINNIWGGLNGPTVIKTLPPPGPSYVHGKLIDNNQIYLEWDRVPNAASYCLEMKEGDDGRYAVIYTGLKATFVKEVPHTGIGYAFRVKAMYSDNTSSLWSIEAIVSVEDDWICGWKECPEYVKANKAYHLVPGNPTIAIKTNASRELLDRTNYSTIIGSKPIPQNRTATWRVRIRRSRDDDGKCIFIGVAPQDIDQNTKINYVKCGWYLYCGASTLWSGPPLYTDHKGYGPRKKRGHYVGTGDTVGVVMNTKTGRLSFILRSVNYGTGHHAIPLDKPLVPCALVFFQGDSVELLK